jgi:sugar lactone lactonase YvrE
MTTTGAARPFLSSGYSWTECPRWHAGRLFFSDLFNARVMAVTPGGQPETAADLSSRIGLDGKDVVVAGIDFLPDGRLLINSMFEQVTLVYEGGQAEVYADLRGLAISPINDMVVDAQGRVYVSQLGFDLWAGEARREAPVMVIEPDGRARVAEEGGDLAGPNGMALFEDGGTLLVAEPMASRITVFDHGSDGTLSRRRVFAQLDQAPDGICADAAGGVWAGQPGGGGVSRVLEGGAIDALVTVAPEEAGAAIACVLGNEDRRTLYICCGFEVMDWEKSRLEAKGSIWSAPVDISGGHCRP